MSAYYASLVVYLRSNFTPILKFEEPDTGNETTEPVIRADLSKIEAYFKIGIRQHTSACVSVRQ
jgi:hypothetical protein